MTKPHVSIHGQIGNEAKKIFANMTMEVVCFFNPKNHEKNLIIQTS